MVLVLKRGATKRQMILLERKLKSKRGLDVMKYCGKIKLKLDPMEVQQQLRAEWK